MPSHWGLRPLKAWRYVGVFGPEIMLCAAYVRVGPVRQSFWAIWDRAEQSLYERTSLGRGGLALEPGRVRIRDRGVDVELSLGETAGIETVSGAGGAYSWTRKQGGVPVSGTVALGEARLAVAAGAVIDDTAAYYPRHTSWHWSAGVGESRDGRALAWNLVSGVNDAPVGSERTVWVDGEPTEPGPCRFSAGLARVDELVFHHEAERARAENLLLVRSSYRQPFGTFSGCLPGGIEVAEGYGVMEAHEAWW